MQMQYPLFIPNVGYHHWAAFEFLIWWQMGQFVNSYSPWSVSLCICIVCEARQSWNHYFWNSLSLLLKIGVAMPWNCWIKQVQLLLKSFIMFLCRFNCWAAMHGTTASSAGLLVNTANEFPSHHFICTALHCTALHCTALHCTALHCTGPCCTIPVLNQKSDVASKASNSKLVNNINEKFSNSLNELMSYIFSWHIGTVQKRSH